jgi:ketosteroid isomerase-like protein
MAVNRKEVVQRINEAFAENNLEKVLSFCTDDLEWTMVGDTTVAGKDAIRKWVGSMDPQPPQLDIRQVVAEGDTVVCCGDMVMQGKSGGPGIAYTFCDIYRFSGDKVAQLTAFVIRTDQAPTSDQPRDQANHLAGTHQR